VQSGERLGLASYNPCDWRLHSGVLPSRAGQGHVNGNLRRLRAAIGDIFQQFNRVARLV
jgi:hypothetical protein